MQIEFPERANIERHLDEIGASVKRSLECAWKDPVQESFYGFADDAVRGVQKIKQTLSALDGVKRDLEEIDIDKLEDRLADLVRLANGI